MKKFINFSNLLSKSKGKKEFKSTLKSIYGVPAKFNISLFGITFLYP